MFLYFYTLHLIKIMDLDLNFRSPKSWQDLDMLQLCTKANFVAVCEDKLKEVA